jgi:DNA-directed RNA polymerase III subunit RPC6
LHGANNSVVYQLVDEEVASKFRDLSQEDEMVYQVITKVGCEGIWTRDIKMQTGIQQQSLNRTLKKLENAKLVKSVKSFQSKWKMYLQYDLQPATSLTGGPWYTEQEFDSAYVQQINDIVESIVNGQADGCTIAQIRAGLDASGIVKATLGMHHVRLVLDCLIHGNRIERCEPPAAITLDGDEAFYRTAPQMQTNDAFTDIPCGVCPVVSQCVEGGIISPATCHYMSVWLDL